METSSGAADEADEEKGEKEEEELREEKEDSKEKEVKEEKEVTKENVAAKEMEVNKDMEVRRKGVDGDQEWEDGRREIVRKKRGKERGEHA